MSTYYGMSAIVVGETAVIRQLHALVVEDETQARFRSEVFWCKEIEVGREGYSAILYRAERSQCRPVSIGTLCSEDANNILKGREVCEYLYWFAESDQDAWSECEFRGVLLAKGSSDRRGSHRKVDRMFADKCRELQVDGAALMKQFPTEEDGVDPRGPAPEIIQAEDEPLLISAQDHSLVVQPLSDGDDSDIPF